MHLEDIKLSEVSRSQENKSCLTPLPGGAFGSISRLEAPPDITRGPWVKIESVVDHSSSRGGRWMATKFEGRERAEVSALNSSNHLHTDRGWWLVAAARSRGRRGRRGSHCVELRVLGWGSVGGEGVSHLGSAGKL